MSRVVAAVALAAFIAAMVVIAVATLSSHGGNKKTVTTITRATIAPRTQPPKPRPKPPVRIKLVAVGPYDPPPGDGTENDSDVPKAVDGNPTTFWSTAP